MTGSFAIAEPGTIAQPDASNTGPRIAASGSLLSSDDAIAAAQANGNILEGARISSLSLELPEHADLIFRDCEIGTGAGSGFRPVSGWFAGGSVRPGDGRQAVFEYCQITGGSSASVIGYDMALRHCDIFGGIDTVKARGNLELFACWLHDLWHDIDAHTDCVQTRVGSNILVHWCNLEAFNHPNSPSAAGGNGNGALQSGSVIGDIINFRMEDNWVNGGHFTLRGAPSGSGFTTDQVFRRNKHGRDFTNGPIDNMSTTGVDYDSSNVWQDTGEPVMGS